MLVIMFKVFFAFFFFFLSLWSVVQRSGPSWEITKRHMLFCHLVCGIPGCCAPMGTQEATLNIWVSGCSPFPLGRQGLNCTCTFSRTSWLFQTAIKTDKATDGRKNQSPPTSRLLCVTASDVLISRGYRSILCYRI